MDAALEVLRKVFGYESFRPPQDKIIETVLGGSDCFVLMPTGSGKSLCFQIPSIMRPGVAIVVSPLISLMKDQVDALRQNGVAAACYNSSLTPIEAKKVLNDLDAGTLDLIYVAPERLMMAEFQERLSRIPLALFAIDEAHCVSQWGHDFRPEYVQLGRLRPKFPNVPFIALTATADNQTRADILLRLQLKDPQLFVSGFDRPNIRYSVVEKSDPLKQLAAYIKGRTGDSGIVYCLSRKRVDQVSEAGFKTDSRRTKFRSWWPRLHLVWASTNPTSDLSFTMTCPRTWRVIIRKRAGPAETDFPPTRSYCSARETSWPRVD